MKVLGIGGSPRKIGITDRLLDKALEGARKSGADTEKIILNDVIFRPCQECAGCDPTGICILDDGLSDIYAKIESADGIILSSPIFFASVSAQLKAMIDRFQSTWISKYRLGKKRNYKTRRKGIFISSGGQDSRDYFINARAVVKAFFKTVDVDYCGELFFGGTNEKEKDKEALNFYYESAERLGGDLVSNIR